MPRDDRLLVRFKAQYVDPPVKDRLWRELVDHAIEHLGADSFSAQMDLLDESLPPEAGQARESLVAHTELQTHRRSFLGLKPPRWPLEPATRKWIEDAGPWIYRLTIWKGNAWALESELWGNHLALVVRPDEWSRLQSEKPWLATLEPPPSSEPFRKEDEHVRRGWSLSRRVRALAALVTTIVVSAFSSLEEGSKWFFYGPFMGIVAYFFLPSREPGPASRLLAQARLPTDPRFNRRFQRTLNLISIAALVVVVAAPLIYLSDPGSAWRLAFWSLAVLGLILALYGVGVTLWWMFKYRRREPL